MLKGVLRVLSPSMHILRRLNRVIHPALASQSSFPPLLKMLRRPKPLKLLFSLFNLSPFSATPNRKTPVRDRRPKWKPPPSTPPRRPLAGVPQLRPTPSPSSDAEAILTILSSPSLHSKTINALLDPFNHKLSSDLILHTLHNYPLLSRTKTLLFFSHAASLLRFRLSAQLLEFISDFLYRRKLFDDLKCLLTAVSSHGGTVPPRAVALSIRYLGRDGRVREALSLFEAMETQLNCPPDNLVFNNVLYVLCKVDLTVESVDIALKIFRRIEQQDVYSYSNILVGLCRLGRLESALQVFDEMGKDNLVPTRTVVNSLIGELCKQSANDPLVGKVRVENVRRPFDILVPNLRVESGVRPAVEVFRVIAKLGLLPSTHILNGLISQLCKSGRIEEAVGIVEVVGERNVMSLGESYIIVLTAFCEVGKMDGACDVFRKMVSQGFKLKVSVYNLMIRAFCKKKDVLQARNYFEMMSKRRCVPDCGSYTMLINAYCGVGDWEAGYGMLMEMVRLGWHPRVETYDLVDDLLKKNGKLELSGNLERKMHIQILCSHCKAGKLDDSYRKLSSMLAKGIHVLVYARDQIERAFHRSGEWKLAQKLLDKMDQSTSQNSARAQA